MSTNCVRCVTNRRSDLYPYPLMCKECADKEWNEQCRKALAQYPAFASFIEIWAMHCGAPKAVFVGQTLRMILDVINQVAKANEAPEVTTVSDLMHALVDNIEEDILLAMRFAYYVRSKPLISDTRYDEAEKEFVNRPEIEDTPLMNPGSDKEEDYPARIRALYAYLSLARLDQSTGKAPNAALSAKSSPVKALRKGKGAKPGPEAEEPLTWGKLF